MLDIVLSKKWFDKIDTHEKNIEFRRLCKFWDSRILKQNSELLDCDNGKLITNTHDKCILRCGYTSKNVLYADISKIEIWDKKQNDLEINPVYAIYLENVRKEE